MFSQSLESIINIKYTSFNGGAKVREKTNQKN